MFKVQCDANEIFPNALRATFDWTFIIRDNWVDRHLIMDPVGTLRFLLVNTELILTEVHNLN